MSRKMKRVVMDTQTCELCSVASHTCDSCADDGKAPTELPFTLSEINAIIDGIDTDSLGSFADSFAPVPDTDYREFNY